MFRANEEETDQVLDILSTYEVASGQKLNMEKSKVSFSRNIDLERKNMLQMKLSFKAVEGHDKYLGLPTYIGGSKKIVFQSIQDRVWKKLKGWKENFLSQAGLEILIKFVAQAIPTYAMQCFTIPSSILNVVERLCRNFFWGQKGEERKIYWVAWNKMCRAKNQGGLGFRNMQLFNKAMLAKQAWRIVTNEHSLMSRVLKGKYFPHSNFFDVKPSSNMSFTWRSILSVRGVIEKGARKMTGKGSTINIWDDPWVPNLPDFRILSSKEDGEHLPNFVCELWEDKRWNLSMLNEHFTQREVKEICSIPIPIYEEEDGWTWHHSKNGMYNVRSTYNLLVEEEQREKASSSAEVTPFQWKAVWKARVPPKVKMFAWKCAKNGVPVRSNLVARGMSADSICPMCGNGEETLMHMLLLCPDVASIWRYSALRLDTQVEGCVNFRSWCSSMEGKIKESIWWDIFWSLAWGVWLRRNGWVFERKMKPATDIIHKALSLVGEYENALEKGTINQPLQVLGSSWKAPGNGLYKLNSDVAILGQQQVGFGGVLRDAAGDVLMACCCVSVGEVEVDVGEAMPMRQCVLFSREAGFNKLILETDNLKLFHHMKKGVTPPNAFGNMVKDILKLVSDCHFVSFSFVKRSGNSVAHSLAKLSSKYDECRIWLEEYPSEIHDAICTDCDSMME